MAKGLACRLLSDLPKFGLYVALGKSFNPSEPPLQNSCCEAWELMPDVLSGTWYTSVSVHPLFVRSHHGDYKSLALPLGILCSIVTHTDRKIKEQQK